MRQHIEKVKDGQDLTADEAEDAMHDIMSGAVSEEDMKEFLLALKDKGESPEEIASFAKVMRTFSEKVEPEVDAVLVDVCGTGGDGKGTFNISTTSMFVVAAAEVPIAKHGNRGITSGSGSADVLEAAGANIELTPEDVAACIEEIGVGFMYAPRHHPAMRHVMGARKALKVRTVFNILGPLTNPAGAQSQLLGVYDAQLTEKMANVLNLLGSRHSLIVNGEPGLDEFSTFGPTKVSELKGRKVKTYRVDPGEYGFEAHPLEDIAGGTPQENSQTMKDVLSGKLEGACTDMVAYNAAGALFAADNTKNMADAVDKAREILAEGTGQDKLEEFIEYTRRY